jgi:hypothetical protein
LNSFSWIDAIVRGEADHIFPELINRWANDYPLDGYLPGITWRDDDGQIHRNEKPPFLQDMDSLPFPAYDLYPVDQINVRLIPIEAGRGCPFECTFCSTNLFFSRRYRIKSPRRLVAEMTFLHENYGYADFDLVHDMLTVDQRWVHRFSRTLIEGGYPYRWGCSARVDCVNPELLAEMAEAGCIGIFFGIETGSQRLQPIVKKKLHTAHVLPTMRTCIEHDMSPTASFITGFPDETVEDALNSLNMALDVLHLSPKTTGQMHMLAPLVGSPLYEKHKDELQFDGHSSDISLFLLTNDEIEVVKRHPDVFPNFYYIPTPHMDRNFTKAVSTSLYACPGLLISLRHAGVDLKDVLQGWVEWQYKNVNEDSLNHDYYLYRFGLDFSRYLREEVTDSVAKTAPYFVDMVDYFEVQYALQRGHITERTVFCQFDYDVDRLDELTRTDGPWPAIEPRPTGILFINLAFKTERGFVYLEVSIPHSSNPVVRSGDVLVIPNLIEQLQMQPNLIIVNKTQERVFTTKHHMTPQTLQALALAA